MVYVFSFNPKPEAMAGATHGRSVPLHAVASGSGLNEFGSRHSHVRTLLMIKRLPLIFALVTALSGVSAHTARAADQPATDSAELAKQYDRLRSQRFYRHASSLYENVYRYTQMDQSRITPADEFALVAENWDRYDFFFVHIKPTDSRGEDGNFEGKAAVIEGVDLVLKDLLNLEPDVLIITGDHSTPAQLRSHSWHPVPTLLWAPASHLPDNAVSFGEREAQNGGLGHFPAADLMPLAMAHALRLEKYGA